MRYRDRFDQRNLVASAPWYAAAPEGVALYPEVEVASAPKRKKGPVELCGASSLRDASLDDLTLAFRQLLYRLS